LRLACEVLCPAAMARIDRNGDLVDILVYVLWIGVLVMILQRA
jgi:hypothetical protein